MVPPQVNGPLMRHSMPGGMVGTMTNNGTLIQNQQQPQQLQQHPQQQQQQPGVIGTPGQVGGVSAPPRQQVKGYIGTLVPSIVGYISEQFAINGPRGFVFVSEPKSTGEGLDGGTGHASPSSKQHSGRVCGTNAIRQGVACICQPRLKKPSRPQTVGKKFTCNNCCMLESMQQHIVRIHIS